MKNDPLFLDTETTGLDGHAEICELSVVDARGSVLMDTLIRPLQPIPQEAADIHGITDKMVAEAPPFAEVLPELQKALYGRKVIIYNLTYDVRLIEQSAKACGQNPDLTYEACYCAMRLYAQFYGKWSEEHNSYHWQQLRNAALQCGIELPRHLHRARVDAELTRQIVKHMTEDEKDHRQLSIL
jgi:DNA polymerase-3 subunit epsilon